MSELQDKQAAMSTRWSGAKRVYAGNGPIVAVYLMTTGEFTKIGFAEDVHRRKKVVQSCCPLAVTLLRVYNGGDAARAQRLEKKLHKMFAEKRVRPNNEWFRLSAADIARCDKFMNYK